MKVLHCIPHVHQGGADRVTTDLVRALQRVDGVEPRLCVFQGGEAPAARLEGLSQPVLLDFRGSRRRPDAFIRFVRTLRLLVKEWKPAIVHSHLWPACQFVTTALLGIPVHHIWHVHDTRPWLSSGTPRDRALRVWTRQLVSRTNPSLIAVSGAAARYTARSLRVEEGIFHHVWNPVDTKVFDPARFSADKGTSEPIPVIGVAARFRPEKGHDGFLRACALLKARGNKFRVRLAGSGERWEAIRQLCRELDLDREVEFLGHTTDVPQFLSGLDLAVLPSIANEGLPLSVLEAMAMRIPIVATDVGGTSEVVHDQETGYLIPPGDVDALVGAIEDALVNSGRRTAMVAKAARWIAKYHTIDSAIERIQDVYYAR